MERLGTESNLGEGVQVDGVQVDSSKIGTPELYFGHGFARKDYGNSPLNRTCVSQPDCRLQVKLIFARPAQN